MLPDSNLDDGFVPRGGRVASLSEGVRGCPGRMSASFRRCRGRGRGSRDIDSGLAAPSLHTSDNESIVKVTPRDQAASGAVSNPCGPSSEVGLGPDYVGRRKSSVTVLLVSVGECQYQFHAASPRSAGLF